MAETPEKSLLRKRDVRETTKALAIAYILVTVVSVGRDIYAYIFKYIVLDAL